MKTEIKSIPTPPRYPYIGYYKNGDSAEFYILFTSNKTGTLLKDVPGTLLKDVPSRNLTAGYVSAFWGEDAFEPFNGEIVLKN